MSTKKAKKTRSIYSAKRLTAEQRAEIAAAPACVLNITLMRKFDTTYATVTRYRTNKNRSFVNPFAQAKIEETPQKFIFTIDKAALIKAALLHLS